MTNENEYEQEYEQGEVWSTRIGIRYMILRIGGRIIEVEKLPHKAKPGVKACLVPEFKSMHISDFKKLVVRDVTELSRKIA